MPVFRRAPPSHQRPLPRCGSGGSGDVAAIERLEKGQQDLRDLCLEVLIEGDHEHWPEHLAVGAAGGVGLSG